MGCKHKCIDLNDGSLDKYCVLCDKKFMQAVMRVPDMPPLTTPNIPNMIPPIMRETITINLGGDIGKVDVYKDKLIEEINKSFREPFRIKG